MKEAEYKMRVRVYIEDTDAGGIVYYVNYLKFMERARTELLRHLGFGKAAILADGKLLVVHSLNAKYVSSARLDEQLTVTAKVIKLARAAITFEQKVWRDNELLCEAEVKIACVQPITETHPMRPSALPKSMYDAIAAFIDNNAGFDNL